MAQRDAQTWSDRAERALAAAGHRTGRARGAVVTLLDSQACALSAVEIEDALRRGERPVARASIYRILDELERLRLVHKVQVGQEMARYEPAREGAEHHHHLVCERCGTVVPFADERLEEAIRSLSRRVPMSVQEHEITLRGACSSCSED